LAEQRIPVFFSPISKVDDEILNLLACGFTQGLHPTEISRVGLNQGGVELVLANELAEAITYCYAGLRFLPT